MRADKGKKKVDETRPTIPLAAKTQSILRIMENPKEARPLKKRRVEDQANLETGRPDSKMKGASPKESSRIGDTETTPKVESIPLEFETPTLAASYKKVFEHSDQCDEIHGDKSDDTRNPHRR